jgi:hypothetical protein
MLHRRVVRGDVVTFSHDFARRTTVHTEADDAQDYQAARSDAGTQAGRAEMKEESPSNPIVNRVRDDLSWDDVVRSSCLPVRLFSNGFSSQLSLSLLFFIYHLLFYYKREVSEN